MVLPAIDLDGQFDFFFVMPPNIREHVRKPKKSWLAGKYEAKWINFENLCWKNLYSR